MHLFVHLQWVYSSRCQVCDSASSPREFFVSILDSPTGSKTFPGLDPRCSSWLPTHRYIEASFIHSVEKLQGMLERRRRATPHQGRRWYTVISYAYIDCRRSFGRPYAYNESSIINHQFLSRRILCCNHDLLANGHHQVHLCILHSILAVPCVCSPSIEKYKACNLHSYLSITR